MFDLRALRLEPGVVRRERIELTLEPFMLGGQRYEIVPSPLPVEVELQPSTSGLYMKLVFHAAIEGPCMRCLEPAALDLDVEAREVHQSRTDDPELQSPYVSEDELDIGRWAHDATILALPTRILCRPDCAGLCPICGESLNDNPHQHEEATDPRWSALKDLKLE